MERTSCEISYEIWWVSEDMHSHNSCTEIVINPDLIPTNKKITCLVGTNFNGIVTKLCN